METDIAIDIKNVSKVYKMYERPVDRLKETLSFGRRNYHKDFYALDHVSFQVKKGDTVGIIGRNGAGKSTLLKIITGVLAPSSGEVNVNGKISSLLELGAGFNPEFTGIENIYLNGTIMGFNKEEIDAKLNQILEFADIGDFVYQPVKTYSSGMYVRLAFSVAINVDPDILVVDEALAVGDARFQLKCFKRLEELKNNGVTIIFVSHAIDQIKSFCRLALLLEKGKILFNGGTKDASIMYYDLIFPKNNDVDIIGKSSEREWGIMDHEEDEGYFEVSASENNEGRKFGVGGAQIQWMRIYGTKGTNVFEGGERITIRIKYFWDQEIISMKQIENDLRGDVGIGIALADQKGSYVFGCNNYDAGLFIDYTKSNYAIAEFDFVMPYLKSGNYFFTAAVSCGTQENHIQLCWLDYFAQVEFLSCKKNVYGIMHLDYSMKNLK